MDRLDKGILMVLDVDCRVSYEYLARKFGVSSNAIKRRVAKMVESGVIEQYDTIIVLRWLKTNPRFLNWSSVP